MQKCAQQKTQNGIIACIAKFVGMKSKDIVEEKNYFSVIADKMIDRYSNKEILLLCLRYLNIAHEIDVPVIGETILDFNHVQGRPTGKVIGNHIPCRPLFCRHPRLVGPLMPALITLVAKFGLTPFRAGVK